MAGETCWNSDQAFTVGECLNLKSDEFEYFCLLVELERCGYPKRRTHLQKKIKDLRRQNLRTARVLNADPLSGPNPALVDYFSDPYHSLVHVFLSMPKYRRGTHQISESLGLTREHLGNILEVLRTLGLIRYDARTDTVEILKSSIHTPSGSALPALQQQLYRAMAIDRLHRCPADRKNGFSVVFAGDVTLQETIWAEFLDFVKRIEKLAKGSIAEEIFYLQFDLFPWSPSRTSKGA